MTDLRDYYNRYDRSKKWKEILFLSKRAVQSAEFNELQKIIRDDFKAFAESLYKDGNLLEGGNIKIDKGKIYLEEGKTIYKGYIVDIENTEIPLKEIGTQTIGIAIKEKILTELDDPELRNPAVGTKSYNEPGAYRLVITGRWTDSENIETDEQFFPVYEIVDGVLQTPKRIAPEIEVATSVLKRYDADSNGNYVVEGLIANYEGDDEENKQHIISISEGKAHVEGEEIVFQYGQKVRVDFGEDTKEVVAEPHIFSGDGEYTLRYTPIAKINQILGVKQITETIVHGNYTGAKDRLKNTPVLKVLEVRQGTTVYKEGEDYTIIGDTIDWSLNGNEPSPGSSYEVVYQYQTTDIQASITEDKKAVFIKGLAEDTSFYISYEYYVPRIDRITLLKDGTLKVLKGIPSDINPQPPQNTSGLSLAIVKVVYGEKPQIELDFVKAFKMSDIQWIVKELQELKYNQAQLTLKDNARSIDVNAKDIFVDAFMDDRQRDLGQTQNAVVDNGVLKSAINWQVIQLREGEPLTLDMEEETPVTENTARSGERLINQFEYDEPPPATIRINPSIYRFTIGTIWRVGWGANTTRIIPSYPVPRINLRIYAGRFNGNEQVEVYIDGKYVGKLTANSNGYINNLVRLPSGILSGRKLVKLKGLQSGIEGRAIFTAIAVQNVRWIRPCLCCGCWWRWWRDPVAQTFKFVDKDFFLSSIELHFPKAPKGWIQITLVNTTVGIPDLNKLIYTQRFENLNEGWNKLKLNTPIEIKAEEEYAIIVESEYYDDTISVAKLGKWDIENRRWITKQALDGVLLISANKSTWTPIQDEDLTIKLNKATFKNQKLVELGIIEVEDITDLAIFVDTAVYPDTNIEIIATLIDRNNAQITLNPYIPVSIEKYTGQIKIEAILRTNNPEITPVLGGSIQLAVGQVEFPSIYISRYFETKGDNLNVYLEVKESESSKVDVYYRSGASWLKLSRDLTKAKQTGDGFVEIPFIANITGLDSTQIKIELTSTDELQRPEAKNLRAIVV